MRGVLSLDEIDKMESGDPIALGPPYEALLERWRAELRDRETALRLLFLAWYAVVEPSCLTGLPHETDLVATEVFEYLGGPASDDPEFLLVAAHMVSTFPWVFVGASEREWERRGRACRAKAERLGISELPPERFAGRGEYGTYFAHIATVGGMRAS